MKTFLAIASMHLNDFFDLKTQKVRGKYPHGVSKIRHAKYCYSTHKGTNTF